MTTWHVHYRAADGEIVGYENCEPPSSQPDCLILSVDTEDEPGSCFNGVIYKVDLDIREIVEKTDAEKQSKKLPSNLDTRAAIASELERTDSYMVPDRPLSDVDRAAWKTYRQSLRDLSKITDTRDRIKAWPIRPDGIDAASALKR